MPTTATSEKQLLNDLAMDQAHTPYQELNAADRAMVRRLAGLAPEPAPAPVKLTDREYTEDDAERLHTLVRKVGKWRKKEGLTIEDILIALRYEKPHEMFMKLVARAEQNVQGYLDHKGIVGDVED